MSAQDIVLAVVVILVPLSIAVAVTLWTLQPAALRAERARRSQQRAAERASTVSGNTEDTDRQGPHERDQNESR